MEIQKYVGKVATLVVYETYVKKKFLNRHPDYDGMYEAEVEGLCACANFDFTPKLLLNDPGSRTVTMTRVGSCDGLDWMLKRGFDKARARKGLLFTAFTLRKQLMLLHEHNIYHGDVKLENIMVDFDEDTVNKVYLIDFATSSFLNKADPKHRSIRMCSDSFSTIEALYALPRSARRDDVWSFLACLFVWVSGGTPMFSRDDESWQSSFLDWYHHGNLTYWDMVTMHGTLSAKACRILLNWFTDLKRCQTREAIILFPSEEEIELLFDA
jgi:serine/threonine protein kinase